MEVGGVAVVQLVRILRARLNLALNQLRPARRDIKAILAADPNSPQVRLRPLGCSPLVGAVLLQPGMRLCSILAADPNSPQVCTHHKPYVTAAVLQCPYMCLQACAMLTWRFGTNHSQHGAICLFAPLSTFPCPLSHLSLPPSPPFPAPFPGSFLPPRPSPTKHSSCTQLHSVLFGTSHAQKRLSNA